MPIDQESTEQVGLRKSPHTFEKAAPDRVGSVVEVAAGIPGVWVIHSRGAWVGTGIVLLWLRVK